jgi:hypothetical protein
MNEIHLGGGEGEGMRIIRLASPFTAGDQTQRDSWSRRHGDPWAIRTCCPHHIPAGRLVARSMSPVVVLLGYDSVPETYYGRVPAQSTVLVMTRRTE